MSKLKKLYTEQDASKGKKGKFADLPDWLGPVLKKYAEIKESIEVKDQHEIISLQGTYSTTTFDRSVPRIRKKGNLHKERYRAIYPGNLGF